jgi:hypothetical protein
LPTTPRGEHCKHVRFANTVFALEMRHGATVRLVQEHARAARDERGV